MFAILFELILLFLTIFTANYASLEFFRWVERGREIRKMKRYLEKNRGTDQYVRTVAGSKYPKSRTGDPDLTNL